MDSTADGTYCGFVCIETLARICDTRTLNASPNQRFCVISKRQVSHVETRFDLIGASGKPHMLILETRPLMRDSRKPKQWTPLGPRALSRSISFSGDIHLQYEWRWMLSWFQAALVCPGRSILWGWPWGLWRFLRVCMIVVNGKGRIPVELRGTDLMCGSRVPRLEGVEARNVGIEV